MKPEIAKTEIKEFLDQCQIICDHAKAASRNKKSLAGDNFYGNKFHTLVISLAHSHLKLQPIFTSLLSEAQSATLSSLIEMIKSEALKPKPRTDALRQIRMVCQSQIIPYLERVTANPIPASEQVLPMAVVDTIRRGYIEKVVLQANGCYEHQWYDACAVMIRRFVETLIIECYEAKGRAADIQDNNGNFFMLRDLVDKMVNDKSWNLGRETKSVLPLLKSLGDRSAHMRRYLAKKPDVDKILPGLRVVADDLLHLAGLK